MACQNCQKIRTAILHGRMAEAAGITVEVLREKIGFKAPEDAPPAIAAIGEVPQEWTADHKLQPAEPKAAKGK
ncbi:hypothetical protein [Sphingopyxis macrogoltabida]|uniref:hypothetical protein n=1 Tax=Sphingopyxis macrogoltabida TaxID=33050 RepID=UPI0006ECE437|nr:hypothetical protein [Sphingopyxis macrogoltabida]ALJ12637.1 nitrogen regulatory IIA protein [Sphingopyxis macrogoltabida]